MPLMFFMPKRKYHQYVESCILQGFIRLKQLGERSSVPFKYTVAIYTGMQKKTLDTTMLTLNSFAHVFMICRCFFFHRQ